VTVIAGPEHWAKNKPVPDGYVTAAAFADVITYRMLDYWTHAGYLQPAHAGLGPGHSRLWPEAEVGVARAIRRLTDAGVAPDTAAAIAREGPGRYPLRRDVTVITAASLWEET
jgi:hypothetical protein